MNGHAANGADLHKKPIVTGALIAGVGGIITMIGVLISVFGAASGARDYVRHMDHQPREVAQVKWNQAKSAGHAGVDAWKHASVNA